MFITLLVLVVLLAEPIKGSIDLYIKSGSNTAHAALTDPDPDNLGGLGQFTACANIYVTQGERDKSMTLFSYCSDETEHDNEFVMEVHPEDRWAAVYLAGKNVMFRNVVINVGKWTHLCTSWDTEGRVKLYVDGTPVDDDVEPLNKGGKLGGRGFLVLGNDQEKRNGGYEVKDGFRGRISDVNFWSYPLSGGEVMEAARCQLQGDIIGWADSQWGFYDNLVVRPSTSPCAQKC